MVVLVYRKGNSCSRNVESRKEWDAEFSVLIVSLIHPIGILHVYLRPYFKLDLHIIKY